MCACVFEWSKQGYLWSCHWAPSEGLVFPDASKHFPTPPFKLSNAFIFSLFLLHWTGKKICSLRNQISRCWMRLVLIGVTITPPSPTLFWTAFIQQASHSLESRLTVQFGKKYSTLEVHKNLQSFTQYFINCISFWYSTKHTFSELISKNIQMGSLLLG